MSYLLIIRGDLYENSLCINFLSTAQKRGMRVARFLSERSLVASHKMVDLRP